jgi:hypothetical protein
MDVYMRSLLDMYDRHRDAAGEKGSRRLVLIERHRDQVYKFGPR